MPEMSSSEPRAEISSGSVVVSAKSHKHKDMRMRRETRQSPFTFPDSNNIFLQSISEKKERIEEMRKHLALPIDEKTTQTARMTAKMKEELVEEEEEKEEKVKPIKCWTGVPKQTATRKELKKAMMKRENIARDSKHDLISMERQKAVLELCCVTKRTEIQRMDEAIAKEEGQLKRLEKTIERDNLKFEEFLRENEKKSVEARTLFEREAKSKQEKNAEIKKLRAEIWTIKGEIEKYEETLLDYRRYKELLFKLSPPEWQEAQRCKALNREAPAAGDAQEQTDGEAEEAAGGRGSESEVSTAGRELPSLTEPRQQITISALDGDGSECEDEPELFFTDPQQLMNLVTELTEQNLSLIQNRSRVEETLEELRQSLETTRKKIERDEEQLKLQIDDMNQRIDKEKARGAKLKQKVQLHISLNSEDQDVMLDSVGEKVTEVHRCCVDDRRTNLSTLEKLAGIENRMSLLLLGLESIPEDSLETMKKIKDSEKRTRQREEKQREQREKQQERMRRYLERSMADSKKTVGRKLMPRSMPAAQKVRVSEVENSPAEDEIHAYLFTADDIE